MECIMGKAGCHIGAFGDSTPYNDCTVEDIAKVLEMSGMERYGNEIMYNGRTGEQIRTEIFIGPTYYQRLKHMVTDKVHCLTEDHEVLTDNGWKSIADINKSDNVAILKNDKLVYEKPIEIYKYPDYKGYMYNISNNMIDLDVTIGHRMYVKDNKNGFNLIEASKIQGQQIRYKKDSLWNEIDYQLTITNSNQPINMEAWLSFFGRWIAQNGITVNNSLLINEFGNNDNKDIIEYIKNLDKYKFPSWVWELSTNQCRILVKSMVSVKNEDIKNNFENMYCTLSETLADDMMRLLIHAGWSGIKSRYNKYWKITIIKNKNKPIINNPNDKSNKENIYYYQGSVYCLSVSTEIFMVRRNGKSVWTGNSRGSNGPIVMLTRQPSEGRARSGGLRLGEMERDCFIAHGTSNFLAERMLHVSDNYRIFICKKCGMHANVNTDKNIYSCKYCKNNTDIAQVRMPYAFKLLNQELYTMNIMMRYICN